MHRVYIPKIGERFGTRIVIEDLGMTPRHVQRVAMQCDCGAVAETDYYSVRKGRAERCYSCAARNGHEESGRAVIRQTQEEKRIDRAAIKAQIIARMKAGETGRAVARDLKMHETIVTQIARGKRWGKV